MTFNVIKAPIITATGKGLSRSKIIKGDTTLIQMRIGGDSTGAVIKFTGRLRDDPFKSVVIEKSSTTFSQIYIEATGLTLFSDVTIQLASSDTAVLDPNTVIEYDIQIQDDVSYGGTSGAEVTISPATFTLHTGTFTVIDQVTI